MILQKSISLFSRLVSRSSTKHKYYCSSIVTNKTALPKNANNHIVWVDMEMTGLDVQKDQILEVACLITNHNLEVISNDLCIIIHQPNNVLENMNEWCMHHHKESGLIAACQSSKVTLKEAEQILLNHIKKYVPQSSCPLAGNSVYMDRFFLLKHMPLVNDYLHYRIIDVSSIKELTRRWNNTVFQSAPKKKFHHRALDDIRETIEELKHYKCNLFEN